MSVRVKMETTVVRNDNILKLTIHITNGDIAGVEYLTSEEFDLIDAIRFQIRHSTYTIKRSNNNYSNITDIHNIDFIKLTLKNPEANSKYAIKLSCPDFGFKTRFLLVDDSGWQVINESNDKKYKYDISVEVELLGPLVPFAVLYNDPMTDFTLQSEDGSVDIHKSCLAAISPIFRSKLLEKNNESEMKINDTNVQTLMAFKKCLYLNVLPEDNLEQLLLLISYFKIKPMEIKCVDKILNGMDPARVMTLLQFALQHNLMALFLGILQNVQNGSVKVSEIRNKYLESI